MAIDKHAAVQQLRHLKRDYTNAKRSSGGDGRSVSAEDLHRLITRSLAALDRLAPTSSAYRRQADIAIEEEDFPETLVQLMGVVEALLDDYEQDAMQSVLELAHADLFDDFLGMSAELSEKGFLGPAAVVAGSVLEEHVRKLATKHGVDLLDDRGRARGVEDLSVDLRKKEVFTEAQRKILTGWYGVRSDAAHGHFDKLDARDIERMIDSVRDIVVRFPA